MSAAVDSFEAPHSESSSTTHKIAHLNHDRDAEHDSAHDQDRLPDPADVDRAGDLLVLDEEGLARPFRSLYSRTGDKEKSRHLVIFVRFFFCGLCQEYLRTISRTLPPSSLPSDTTISIIGCGQPVLIPDYRARTSCPYSIYADPSRNLYEIFGMMQTLYMGDKQPEYQVKSTTATIFEGMAQVISSGSHAFKGGKFAQVGGEMLFVNGEVVWAHRMRHTRDHSEMSVLKGVLGM